MDELHARLTSMDTRLAAAEAAWKELAERPASVAAAEDVRAVAHDLRALREWLDAEFSAVNERFADISRRVEDAGAPPDSSPDAPLSPEEEDRWTTLSRDADAGVRFSALHRLGRLRTERSVHVSVERLADETPKVVWQALRNLGRFREVAAAGDVARLLDHADAEVRAAAHSALVDMGAPKDTGFDDPAASADKRKQAAAALKSWAESR